MHTEWPWMWVLTNGLTGLSYVAITVFIVLERQVRVPYSTFFAVFIAACGFHHLVHTLPVLLSAPYSVALDAVQTFVDLTMMVASVGTAVMVAVVYFREHRMQRIGERHD